MISYSHIARYIVFFTLFAGLASISSAQTLPRAGRDFTFGIIEGPDNLDSSASSLLTLTVASHHIGCGVITSAAGYTEQFTFAPDSLTVIQLPLSLMHLNDLGKTNKGILVHTSEPVNLTLHDYAPQAGDATQIFPDEALDTSYVASEWGLYDDPGENNHCQFLVSTKDDGTIVTITPTVQTMLGQPPNVPFSVTLNRGECYIVKADITDFPVTTSLANSKIVSTKPVSVIVGTTCGYVPLEFESCNELLDELIGKKWWGEHYFVQPLGNLDTICEIVITSDRSFFATVNGSLSLSSSNRLTLEFSGTAEIVTSVPTEMTQLARGSSKTFAGISDPTMVTILDTSLYADSMIFVSPHFNGSPFQHWAPIIYPTASANQIMLDGRPLTNYIEPTSIIHGSTFSAITPSMNMGIHTLYSPVPIFALGTGFDNADAYSFIAGTTAPYVPHDTIHHSLLLKPEPAQTCSDFGVVVSLDSSIGPLENVISIEVPITYDPATLLFVDVEPLAVLQSATYTVDSTAPGILIVNIFGTPIISGKDLFRIVFAGKRATGSTMLNTSVTINACGESVERITSGPIAFSVAPGVEALRRALLAQSTTATICQPLTILLSTDSIVAPSDGLVPIQIEVTYDTSVQKFVQSIPGALFTNVFYTESGQIAGDYLLHVTTPQTVSGSDTLLLLKLQPVTGDSNVTIHAKITYLLCGDTVTKDLVLNYPVVVPIDSAHTTMTISTVPVTYGNPTSADVTLSGLPNTANVTHFDLYLTYNHDVITYSGAVLGGTLTSGWTVSSSVSIDPNTDKITFTSNGGPLGVSGILAHLLFQTFISDSSSTPIHVSSSLPSANGGCEILYQSPAASTLFLGKELCGDSILRAFLERQVIVIQNAQQSPSGDLDVTLQAGQTEDVSYTITNTLGQPIASGTVHCTPGVQNVLIPLPSGLASGAYILRVESNRAIASRKILLVR
jgi:hypothetical protein